MLQAQESSQIRPKAPIPVLERLESSIDAHAKAWAATLLTAGLAIRIWHASGTFLNADEAMHFAAANQPSWWLTYKASLSLAHPPLLIFLLHVWRHLGTSELMLRMPSILAGTAFCWFAFLWMSLLFEKAVAWSGFLFLIFLPASVQLSSEVRQYAVLLLFAAASAYFLELALAKCSVRAMLLSGACLWLAILSHFSAFLFATALGIYAIVQMIKHRTPLPVFAAWEFAQVIAIALSYFLYVTQIAGLEQVYRGFSVTRGFTPDGFLAKYYFVRGAENPISFALARTGGFFQFAFHQLAIGDLTLILFLIGVGLLFFQRAETRIDGWILATLLLLPFGINCVAALWRIYPYGGSRHSAFLLPFAVAGVSLGAARICGKRRAYTILFAAAILMVCGIFPSRQFAESRGQKKRNMNAALGFIRQLPPTEPIFTDVQSSLLVAHYLCGQRAISEDQSHPAFASYECDGHRAVVARQQYVFRTQSFSNQIREFVREYSLRADEKIWVAQIGVNMPLSKELEATGGPMSVKHFGSEISFIELSPGQTVPDK